MAEKNTWQLELNEYIKQGEPKQAEKSKAWQTAIGLQEVDGLKTSSYLLDTAKEHIEGKISINEAKKRIFSYYEKKNDRKKIEMETAEADIVSTRIAELLGEKTFQFSPAEFCNIHYRLFKDVFEHAGKIREYNIIKKEWILKGNTVIYAPWNSIEATLDYDFKTEKEFSYKNLTMKEIIFHLAKFTSDIWQIHPFLEGNTRATAVFMIKYMKTLGIEINNSGFKNNSWYFRNALVRANFNDVVNGIYSTTEYLELFFGNLILKTNYELKNRSMHLDYISEKNSDTLGFNDSNCESLNESIKESLTENEKILFDLFSSNPKITQKEIVLKTSFSRSTVQRIIKELINKNKLERIGSKKDGSWIIKK